MNNRLKQVIAGVTMVTTAVTVAGPNGDRPDVRHAWAVHDDNRPNPVEISAEEGQVPSDAIVLFDGTQKSVDEHWCDKAGNPTKWIVKDGLFYCVPKSGMAYAKDRIGDCQIHVEFMIPNPPGDGLGNSGVYVHGLYELQLLHSFHNTDMYHPIPPWKHANYADGQCGAIYGQNPPIVNPCRDAGKWQSYDIVFHPAVWDGDTLVEPATITAFLNGVLIQDNWKLEGPTDYIRRAKHDKSREVPISRALALQDHGNPCPYRNIWVRSIPSRRANTVHGGDYYNPADAGRLREKLAVETLAKADKADNPASRLVWLWESYAYREDAAVRQKIESLTDAYVDRIRAWKGEISSADRSELSNMSGFVDMGIRCGLFAEDDRLVQAVRTALRETSSSVKHY